MKIRVRLSYLYRAAYTVDYFISNGRSCDHYLTRQRGILKRKFTSAFIFLFRIRTKNQGPHKGFETVGSKITSFVFSTHRWTAITSIRTFEAKENPENQI